MFEEGDLAIHSGGLNNSNRAGIVEEEVIDLATNGWRPGNSRKLTILTVYRLRMLCVQIWDLDEMIEIRLTMAVSV